MEPGVEEGGDKKCLTPQPQVKNSTTGQLADSQHCTPGTIVGDGIQFIASSVDSKVAGSDRGDCTARVQSWSFWGPQTTGESRR